MREMVQQASVEMPPHQKQHQKQQRADENSSPPLLGRHARTAASSDQGVMVPGEESKQHPSSSSDVSGDRTVEPLIVFDWDDTILTSSWIQVNELLQAGSYDDLPLEVRRDLAQLERRCVLFLQLKTIVDLRGRHQSGGLKKLWACCPAEREGRWCPSVAC